jgi:mannose/fructose/N-acetylgalactosamine-specific phosphotransferase system component IIB
MDFVIEKKLFDGAMRQVLLGRKTTPDDLVDLIAEVTMLTIVALGTSVQVPVVSEITGSVSMTVGDLAKLKKISTTCLQSQCGLH